MNYFWLDASAIVKRYINEVGTPEMKYFLKCIPPERMMVCTPITIGEVIYIFGRRIKNNALYNQQKQLFETEISQHSQVLKVYPNKDQMEDSLQFIELHPINTTDALILKCALDKAKELRTRDHDLILVSSDNKFLKAARSEGLITFNPERNKQTYLDNLNA